METTLITSLAQLGPATGAIAIIAVLFWKLLQLFENHSKALATIQNNMQSHSDAMREVSKNVDANTRLTEKVVDLLSNKK